MILLFLFYILSPAGVIWLCRRFGFLNKIGAILLLYILGALVANLSILPENAGKLQNILYSFTILLAIPMLLFNANFKSFSLKKLTLTLFCGLSAILVSIVAGYFIFQGHMGEESYKIGGMVTGAYVGGTANVAALQLMFGIPEETFILINTYDMVVCFLYLVFLMGPGIRLFRMILPRTGSTARSMVSQYRIKEKYREPDPYVGIFKKDKLIQIAKAVAVSLVILGISLSIGSFVGENAFITVVILCLTSLGIAASFFEKVRKLDKSYDAGMYLIYIFCVVIASMADISNLNLKDSLWLLYYLCFIVFVSLIIQVLLSRLFRVDADAMAITSVALINSPPFVPMIAASMRNRDALVIGLGIGIVGYAVGNYLGFLMAGFFKIIS